jgi:ribosome maturation protein SDO1
MQFRQNIETDLSEVLQTEYVFYMVSKGTFAKKEDLKEAFGDKTEKEICEIILRKGELQISPKERQLVYDNLYKDISTIVANKCINPDTKTPYTATQIEREMKDLNFVLKPNKSVKS